MGVDIHGITQIYKCGRWKTIDEIPTAFDNGFRNSDWFRFLRQNYERGYPSEAEGKWFNKKYNDEMYSRAEFNKNQNNYYGDGYITLTDIENEIEKSYHNLSVPEEWLDLFYYYGGKLPDEMKMINPLNDITNDDRIYFTIEDDECDDIQYWLIKSSEELKKIMRKYNIKRRKTNNIRVVFNFDC